MIDLLDPRVLAALIGVFAIAIAIILVEHHRTRANHRSLGRWLLDVLSFPLSRRTLQLGLQTPFKRRGAALDYVTGQDLPREIQQIMKALHRKPGTSPPGTLNGFVREPRPVRPFLRTGSVALPEPNEPSTVEAVGEHL